MKNYTVAAVACAMLGAFAAQAQVIVPVTAGGPITDNNTGNETEFTFGTGGEVTGINNLPIQDINLRLAIKHPFAAELTATLELRDPDTAAVLASARLFTSPNFGVSPSANFQDTLFDDAASTSINDGAPPYAGAFVPEESLSVFNGLNANGVWVLVVEDNSFGETGTLYAPGEESGAGGWGITEGTYLLVTVPEPSTYAMIFGVGALGFGMYRRYRTKAIA